MAPPNEQETKIFFLYKTFHEKKRDVKAEVKEEHNSERNWDFLLYCTVKSESGSAISRKFQDMPSFSEQFVTVIPDQRVMNFGR